jgi:flagellar basal body rod protein FlgG
MIKGLYAASAAMLAGMDRQALVAHNAANLDTPGFKQVMTSIESWYETPVVQPGQTTANGGALFYLGNMGLGADAGREYTDFSSGPMRSTQNPLDFAINGEGFFRIKTPNGERLTRDGRFLVDAQGNLVTVDGNFILDSGGQPMKIPAGTNPNEIGVAQDGTMFINGKQSGQLGIVNFADPHKDLERAEQNTFKAIGSPVKTNLGTVNQGYLESSNVNMVKLMATTRYYESAQTVVQNQDELLGKAIATLGRIG